MLTSLLVYRALERAGREESVDTAETLDGYLAEEVREARVPGLSLAVLRNGRPRYMWSIGLANVELNVPVARDTVYEIGPLTRVFMSALVMLLSRDGVIGMDDPLSRYREGLAPEWEDVTLRRLLSHTSGVATPHIDWNRDDLTDEQIAGAFFDQPLAAPPGQAFAESGANYNLLGMVLHRATGTPFPQLLEERILAPLAMDRTRVNDPAALVRDRASGYNYENGAVRNADRIRWRYHDISPDVPANGANNGLLSTLPDLVRWERALVSGTVLSREMVAEMAGPVHLESGDATASGLGWEVGELEGHPTAEIAGHVPGFSSGYIRVPSERLAVILLANGRLDARVLARGIATRFLTGASPGSHPVAENG